MIQGADDFDKDSELIPRQKTANKKIIIEDPFDDDMLGSPTDRN
jgi:hypothetical protein